MKNKGYLKFFIIFSLILGIYYYFINNIDKFLLNLDNNVKSYPLVFNYKYTVDNVISDILTDSNIDVISGTNLSLLMENSFLTNIIEKLYPFQNHDATMTFLKKQGAININSIRKDKYDFDIIYLERLNGYIAFSLDNKNLVYTNSVPFEYNIYNKERNTGTIELASEKIKNKLVELGITKQFDFEITTISKSQDIYSVDYSSFYYIEDTKHDIRITYEYESDTITYLRIGFNKSKI